MPLSSYIAFLIASTTAVLANDSPLTCKDLATTTSTELSFEGSWSFATFNQTALPFGFSLSYMTFSGDPLLPRPLQLVSGNVPCRVSDYLWRPDFVTAKGTCGAREVSLVAFYSDVHELVVRYELGRGSGPLAFCGQAPAVTQIGDSQVHESSVAELAVSSGAVSAASIDVRARASAPSGTMNFDLQFILQPDFTASSTPPRLVLDHDSLSYCWHVDPVPSPSASIASTVVTFRLSEFDRIRTAPSPPLPPLPGSLNASATTASIDGWLSEASVPTALTADAKKQAFTAWLQFWLNTEHRGGNWTRDIVTPSMSTYSRGIWLWDTAFHVMGLSTGNGPRSLAKAKDQIIVLAEATGRISPAHTPRCMGPEGAEILDYGTQPPGILSWATLVLYHKTNDTDFLRVAYEAFRDNNAWFHDTRMQPDTGLATWKGYSTGWDTSPRWDRGDVEAVDLNSWLALDHKALGRMAALLGRPVAEQAKWAALANRTTAAIQEHLWSADDGVFWDRLPSVPPARYPACVDVPGPVRTTCKAWSRFEDVDMGCPGPQLQNHCSCAAPYCTQAESLVSCATCQCCVPPAPAPASGHSAPDEWQRVVTPVSFMTLLAGVATPAQARQVRDTLLKPSALLTRHPMPSVGVSEPTFDGNGYWRGPVWVNVNWLSLLGLECYGLNDDATMLRRSILQLVGDGDVGGNGPREYYNPQTGEGLGAKNFMWTGAIAGMVANELAAGGGAAVAHGKVLREIVGCSDMITRQQKRV